MYMILEILVVLGTLVVIAECYILSLWIFAYFKTKKKLFPSYTPMVSVIVPCKGIYYDFQENIQAFLGLDYPRYHLIFVVDSKNDPAYGILQRLSEKKPNVNIVFTKPVSGCSGKVAALLTGLGLIQDAEILVFADSDIKPDVYWLRNIVIPLQDESIGATTGYRWFFPTNWKTLLISAWNMASIVFMFYPSYAFAWGGSTAIRRRVFEKLQIKDRWKTAFSDDLILTIAVKKAGYKIYFQPKCIMASLSERSIRKFIHWGTRQYTWVRWYYPLFWLGSFVGFIGLQVLIVIGLLLLILGYYLPGILLSSIILFEILYGLLGICILPKTMVYPKIRFLSKISYALFMPLVFLLIAQNVFASALTQKIEWAGRIYQKPKN